MGRKKWLLGKSFLVMAALLCCALLCQVQPSAAQSLTQTRFVYTVKFVCGSIHQQQSGPVTDGIYATSINIHNPQPQAVSFFKKVILLQPGQEPVGPAASPVSDELEHDYGMQMSCKDIANLLPNPPSSFMEGFVVIESLSKLDVVAVYTKSSSIEVKDIHPKEITFPYGVF